MMEHLLYINWLGAVLAGFASIIIGGIWYSPFVAGKIWMKVSGFDPEKAGAPFAAMITSFISNTVFAALLSLVLTATGAYEAGLHVVASYGLFMAIVVAAASWQNYAFENKSIAHFLVHTGNHIVSMVAMSFILALV